MTAPRRGAAKTAARRAVTPPRIAHASVAETAIPVRAAALTATRAQAVIVTPGHASAAGIPVRAVTVPVSVAETVRVATDRVSAVATRDPAASTAIPVPVVAIRARASAAIRVQAVIVTPVRAATAHGLAEGIHAHLVIARVSVVVTPAQPVAVSTVTPDRVVTPVRASAAILVHPVIVPPPQATGRAVLVTRAAVSGVARITVSVSAAMVKG